MQIDCRVRLSDTGREEWGPSTNNPHDMEGVVTSTTVGGHGYGNSGTKKALNVCVEWDNGNRNHYAPEDLEVVSKSDRFVVMGKRIDVSCRRGSECRKCIRVCPTSALQRDESRIYVHRELCAMCGLCIEACDHNKIKFEEYGIKGDDCASENTKQRVADRFRDKPRELSKMMQWFDEYDDALKTHSIALADAYATEPGNDMEEAKRISRICSSARQLLRTCHHLPMDLAQYVATMLENGYPPSPKEAVLREIEGILRCFDNVRFDGQILSVCTKEEMVLEDVNFGKFIIYLRLPDGMLQVKAVNPNWPSERGRSHPHLEHDGGGICMGRGQDAFFKAMQEGRICDALLIVRSVLNTYGSENPYQNINSWHEKRCYVCSEEGAHHQHAFCGAYKGICENHVVFCSTCGVTLCANCIMQCDECEAPLCIACATRGKCEHKEDIRNRHWQRRIEDARRQQNPEKLESGRERAREHVGRRLAHLEEWQEAQRRQAEEEERQRQLREGCRGFLPEDPKPAGRGKGRIKRR